MTPLVPTLLGLVALGWHHAEAVDEARQRDETEARAQLAAWVQSESTRDLTRLDPRWRVVDHLRVVGDRVEAPPHLPQEPLPELLQVVHGPQSWPLADGSWAVAVAAGGEGRVLYGVRHAAPEPGPPWLQAGLLVLGAISLGLYLARRIYQPVEWLTAEADAALAGRPSPLRMASSTETEPLRSSMMLLTDFYRSSTHGRG